MRILVALLFTFALVAPAVAADTAGVVLGDFCYVKADTVGARLVGRIGETPFALRLESAPQAVRLHPVEKAVLLGYAGTPSKLVKLDVIKNAAVEVAQLKGTLSRFDISRSGRLIAAAVRQTAEFGTGEIVIIEPGDKSWILAGGADTWFDFPIFAADEKSLYATRSILPDPTVPKFSSIEIVRIELADRKVTALFGGATVFDTAGVPTGFKAAVPSLLPDGRIGFMKTVGHTDKFYAAANPEGAVTDLFGPEETMVEPRSNGRTVLWLSIEPGDAAGTLIATDLSSLKDPTGKTRTVVDGGVSAFDLR